MSYWIVGVCHGDGKHIYKAFGEDREAARRYASSQKVIHEFIWDLFSPGQAKP